jgi:intraflagellar transport protein 172
MYVHQQSWSDALRVAEQYDPSAVTDVYAAQGKAAAEREDWTRAEEMFVAASKPDLALQMYETSGQWQDAVRVAQRHLPHKLNEVNLKLQSAQAGMGTGGSKADYLSKGRNMEKNRKVRRCEDRSEDLRIPNF